MSAAEGSTTVQLDDEDAMGAALIELRADRASVEGELDPVPTAAPAAPAPAATPAATPAADATAVPAVKDPDQLLAEKRQELHRVTSELGRVSALNAKAAQQAAQIADLQRQLATVTTSPKSAAEARDKFADLAEKVKEFPELKELVDVVSQAFKEVDGKAVAVAKAAAKEATAPLEPLRQQHITAKANEQEAANAADLRTFTETYPTANEVLGTADFKEWLPKQSQDIRRAFFQGQTPGEALPVLDAYDAYLRRSGKTSIAHTPQSQQPADQAAATGTTAGKPANDRLARAAGIPSRTASNGAKGALPAADDFDGSLAFFREKRIAAQRAAASN
jgi:hypothetical protein